MATSSDHSRRSAGVAPRERRLDLMFNGVVIATTQRPERPNNPGLKTWVAFPASDVEGDSLHDTGETRRLVGLGACDVLDVKVGARSLPGIALRLPAVGNAEPRIAIDAAAVDECWLDGMLQRLSH